MILHALQDARIECIDDPEGCWVPIRLPTGVDREAVVATATNRLAEVASALSRIKWPDAAAAPVPTPSLGDEMSGNDADGT
jgi:hypothetical protein